MTNDNLNIVSYAELENEIDIILRDTEKQKFIQALERVHQTYTSEQKQENKKGKAFKLGHHFYYYAAASLLALVCLAGVLKFIVFAPEFDNDQIFQKYYQTYQSETIQRSAQTSSELIEAMEAFENKEFYKAVSLFDNIAKTDKDNNIKATFYKGISAIEISDYKNAIESLNKVLSVAETSYIAQSHWYLSLIWIKLNNVNEARKHLNWLVKNDRFYASRAKEILAIIDK